LRRTPPPSTESEAAAFVLVPVDTWRQAVDLIEAQQRLIHKQRELLKNKCGKEA
jgi:hypothetical protein